MAAPRTSRVKHWARVYGVDKRQARRLRRRFALTGERPCPEPGCVLRGERPHAVHYKPGFGPFPGRRP